MPLMMPKKDEAKDVMMRRRAELIYEMPPRRAPSAIRRDGCRDYAAAISPPPSATSDTSHAHERHDALTLTPAPPPAMTPSERR